MVGSTLPLRSTPDPRSWFDGTIDLVNYHHIARHYQLDTPEPTKLSLQDLANRLIHSFVFFFNSDQTKEAIWEMSVAEFQAVIDAVLNDDVAWVDYNKATGRFRPHTSAWRAAQRGLS